MAGLSIVIPAMGFIDLLETSLVSVLEHRPPDCEVLVVLNGEYDDPYQLHDEVRFLHAPAGASLVTCVNAGIAAADGHVVHLLAAGGEVCDGWTEAACDRLADARHAAVAAVVVNAQDRSRVLSAGVEYRASGRRVDLRRGAAVGELAATAVTAPNLAAGFYRADVLRALNEPFSAAVGDHLADVDFGLRIRAAGLHSVLEPSAVVALPAERLPRPAYGFRAGRHAERLFWRNLPTVGWFTSLGCHAAALAGQSLSGVVQPRELTTLLGRALAMGEYPRYARHWRQLAQLHPPHTDRVVPTPHLLKRRAAASASLVD